jgi:hypothetical protein
MAYEAQESYSIRKMAIGLKKQTTYGTKLLDASYVHTPRFEPGAFAEIAADFYADGDKAGKGHNYPVTHKRIAQVSSFQADFDLTDFLALWLGAYHFGSIATSGVNPYTHLMTYLTSTNIMPVTSIYFEDTADVKRHLVDLAIQTLKISGTESGPLKASASFLGSGRETDAALAAPAAAVQNLLLGSDTDILVGNQAAAASIKERVMAWEITFQREMVAHRAPGGGLFSTFHRIAGRERVSIALTIAAKETDDVRTRYNADTITELQINTNGGAALQLNIKVPGFYYTAAKAGVQGNDVVWQVTSDPEKGVIKSGVSNYVEYSVVDANDGTTLLVNG